MSAEAIALPRRPSFPALLWGVIRRPAGTFEILLGAGGRRAWLLMATLALISIALPVIVAGPLLARQAQASITAAQVETQSKGGYGPDQPAGAPVAPEEAAAEPSAASASAAAYLSSPLVTTVLPGAGRLLTTLLAWLVWAGGLYLLGTLLGGRAAFGALFTVVVWAWLPYTLRSLLQAAYIALTQKLIANPGLSGFVSLGSGAEAGALVRPMPPGLGTVLLHELAARADLYLVWSLFLVVVGAGIAARLPRGKAVLLTLMVWVIVTGMALLPSLAGTLLGAAFGG